MIPYRDEERLNVVNVVASTRVVEELGAVQSSKTNWLSQLWKVADR